MRSMLPEAETFTGRGIDKGDYKITRLLGSGCNAHVFVAHSESLVLDVACKIVPVENLIGDNESPPKWMQEVQKANLVPSSRAVKCYDTGRLEIEGRGYVFFLSELVNGSSLREHLKKKPQLDLGFVESFLGEMLDFLRELGAAQLSHGDFHDGNILVEDRTQSLVGPPHAFRVTDFGVGRATGTNGLLDDFEQLAHLLRTLLERVDYPTCSPRDRYVFDALNDDILAKALTERDCGHDARARNPVALHAALVDAQKDYVRQSGSSASRSLTTPFDFLSCEQIGESHGLLKELYSAKMLGLPAIEAVNNLVLTGPRGCGKTTVFRSLSLQHRALTDDDEPDAIRYVGIYYRCDDLYFSFPRYTKPERPEALDVPLHFLTATLARELLNSLAFWLQRRFPDDFSRSERECSRELWAILELEVPKQPDAETFSGLGRVLDKQRPRAAKKQRFASDRNQTFGRYFGPEVLPRICDAVSAHFAAVRERPIFFFVDDYSSPKITAALQQNLNRLVMQRTSACFFKIATESPASYENSDVDGKVYVEGREFALANLGIDFINAKASEKLQFVDDVFGRRFGYTAGYPVRTLTQLIGDGTKESHNEVARKIRAKQYPEVWGRTALGELCSGDVHFLIELVGKMVAVSGGREGLVQAAGNAPAIDPKVQNKTIRTEAGNFLKKLRGLPVGQSLVDVVEAFGAVAASYLRHRDARNEQGSPPHQASRIEPYENPDLNADARQVYEDLLRYSVFIEDVRGKSRRGNVVPRLYLRRFLIPFFNLTFSRRDSLELSVEELRELLITPTFFRERKRLKGPEKARAKGEQLSLLGEKGEDQ